MAGHGVGLIPAVNASASLLPTGQPETAKISPVSPPGTGAANIKKLPTRHWRHWLCRKQNPANFPARSGW